jgi:hypothetical protein
VQQDLADHAPDFYGVIHDQNRFAITPGPSVSHGRAFPDPCMCRKSAKTPGSDKNPSREKYHLMNVHRLTEVTKQLPGASPAGFLLIGVARLAADQFLVLESHGTAADPVVPFMRVNMIEFRHDAMIDLVRVAPAVRPLLQCYFLRY